MKVAVPVAVPVAVAVPVPVAVAVAVWALRAGEALASGRVPPW